MIEIFRGGTLVAATLAMAALAGLLYAFAIAVMPGLHAADDRTFVDALQQINIAILNPWFLLSFLGAPALIIAAIALHWSADTPGVLLWLTAALVLYGVALFITSGASIPLNDALAAAGPADRIADLAQVREHFEASWVRWNTARTVASLAAVGCLAWALVLYGRTSTAS